MSNELTLCTPQNSNCMIGGPVDINRYDRRWDSYRKLSKAKKAVRRYRALGYELYDEKTDIEYAGDLNTVYEAIDNFAVRNDSGQATGEYRLNFRRYRDRYQHIERIISCELKTSKHKEKASNGHRFLVFLERVGISIAALVVLYILEVVTLMLSDIVNCFTATDFETDTFYAVFDVLLYVFIGLCGLAIVVFLILLIIDLSKPRYWISRAHGLVKKDRKLMAQQSQTDGTAIERGPYFVDIRNAEFSRLVVEYKKEHTDEDSGDEPAEESFSLSGDFDDSQTVVDEGAGLQDEPSGDVEPKESKGKKKSGKGRKLTGESSKMEGGADGKILADLDAQRFATVHILYEMLVDLGNVLAPEDAMELKDADIDAIPHILDALYSEYSSPEKSDAQEKIRETIEKLNTEIYPKLEEVQAAKQAFEAPAVRKFRVYRFYDDAKKMDKKTPGALAQYKEEEKEVRGALAKLNIKVLRQNLKDRDEIYDEASYDLCEGTMDQIDELAWIVFSCGFFRCQTDDTDFDGEWRFQNSMPDGTELVSVHCDGKDREHRIARIKNDPILFKDFDCPTDKEYVYRYYPHFWDDGLIPHWDPVLDPNKLYGDELSCLNDLAKCVEQSLGVDVDELYETRRYVEWINDKDN